MLYNLAIVITNIASVFIQLTHYWIRVNSQAICHTATILFILGFSSGEALATDILAHCAYLMYRCYHVKLKIRKKRSQFLFRCYTTYAAFTFILVFFVIIAYDWRTGNGKYTIMESGHCCYFDHPSYNTLIFSSTITLINKFLQITMFSAYLVYFYKFNLNVRAAQVTLQYSRKLFRIAIAMGGTVGLAFLFFIPVLFIPEYSNIFVTIGVTFLLIQQVVIFASLVCTKKVSVMCKGYFSRAE